VVRASRLVAIADLLQNHGRMTAGQLADALEVSPRTILRDISELSSAGIPVYALRGSAGGFELVPGYATGTGAPPLPAGPAPAATGRSADHRASIRAHVLLSPRGRQQVALSGRSADFRVRRSSSPWPAPPGWTEGWLRTGPLENAVRDLLGFGTEIQVFGPPELRHALHERALSIARLHDGSGVAGFAQPSSSTTPSVPSAGASGWP
jgi:predicted DNA-binding transcriptional regulator YafY